MNKAQLLEALQDYPDNAEIVAWDWDWERKGHPSQFFCVNETLGNSPLNDHFSISVVRQVPFTPGQPKTEMDGQQKWDKLKRTILTCPLSGLKAFLEERPDGGHGLQEILSQIEADAELAIRKVEYLEHRIWGGDHEGAVKSQNRMLKKIRAAMTKYITHDVHF